MRLKRSEENFELLFPRVHGVCKALCAGARHRRLDSPDGSCRGQPQAHRSLRAVGGVYSAIRRRERKAGDISAENATVALEILRLESARMVQEPLNPAVLEAARQLLWIDQPLRWPDALELGAALGARDMFQGTEIVFVSASLKLLEAAKAEGFHALDPAKEPAEPAKEAE